VRIGGLRLRDPFGRGIDARHVPTALGECIGHATVAAAELKDAPLLSGQVHPRQRRGDGRQQVHMMVARPRIRVRITINSSLIH